MNKTMEKPVINGFSHFADIMIQRYEVYLPTAFDNNLSLLQKVNKILIELNKLGKLTNNVIDQWNDVMEWVMNDGLENAIRDKLVEKLDEMVADGTFADIINEQIFQDLNDKIDSMGTNVKYEGANGDLIKDDTHAIQKVLDEAEDGTTIIIPKGNYLVSKNTSLTDFPNGDQPALLLRNKKNIHITGYGATLVVKQHAQGILELQGCENIVIEGIKLEGVNRFPNIDYSVPGYKGYGEKGNANGGWHTSGFWGYYKNNSYDTTARTTRSANNEGWGKFQGGFIGNVSYGLLIHRGCKNVVVRDSVALGFNYVGFGVGHNGDYFPSELGYLDSYDITFDNCRSYNNYGANFHSMACDGVNVVNCVSENAGHPNASINDDFIDPGYGFTARGTNFSHAKNINVEGSTFRGNKRKGIDSHSAIGFRVKNNKVYDSWVCGIFANWASSLQPTKRVIIEGNEIEECAIQKNGNASIFVSGRTSTEYSKENIEMDVNVSNNIVVNSGGGNIIEVKVFDKAIVSKNIINGLSSRNQHPWVYALKVGSSTATERSYMGIVEGNMVVIGNSPSVLRGLQVSYLNEGNVSGNVVKMEHESVNIGIFAVSNQHVNYHDNTAHIGSKGQGIQISQTWGLVMNNMSTGGDIETYQYGNGAIMPSSPVVPERPRYGSFYQDKDNGRMQLFHGLAFGEVRRVIHMRVVANTGDGVVTYYGGDNFVSNVASSQYGLEITLKDVSPQTPFVSITHSGSNGISNVNGQITHLYPRTNGWGNVTVGLKYLPTGSHVPFNTITDGAIDVLIMF